MEKKALQATLTDLRAQLSQPGELDEETLELLRDVTDDLHRLVERREGVQRDEVKSLADRIQSLVLKFEADHPRLTSVLSQVADGLANLGI